MAKPPLKIRIQRAVAGFRAKEFIPALTPDGVSFGSTGRVEQFRTKPEQLTANVGWCFTANNAIAEPFSAIQLKLMRKTTKGEPEEIPEHEILELMDSPNLALTGEQMRQLHATYMNFTGESYIYMRDGANPFVPRTGKLPDALDIFPSHRVQFKLGDLYTTSTVKLGSDVYPIPSFIRDINPDPGNPYYGRSLVAAAALILDLDRQMKTWNQNVFANGAQPSLVFKTNETLPDDVYERLKQQINDDHAGGENAHKPWIVENGDVVPYMMNAKDLDFLASRKFSKDEIFAMWRVSPGLVGMTENVNRANLDGAFYINAVVNLVPRIRQFVRQVNATMVKPFDPKMYLDFVSPVPEDVAAKLSYAEKANGGWLTIDEVRALFGEEPLPNGLGEQIYKASTTASLTDIASGSTRPQPAVPVVPVVPPKEPPAKSIPGGVKKNS